MNIQFKNLTKAELFAAKRAAINYKNDTKLFPKLPDITQRKIYNTTSKYIIDKEFRTKAINLFFMSEVLCHAIASVDDKSFGFSAEQLKEWLDFRRTAIAPSLIEQRRFLINYGWDFQKILATYNSYKLWRKEV